MGAFAFPALTDNMYAYASKSGGLAIAYAHWTVFRADMWDAFTIDMNLTAVIDPVATFVGGMTMSANFASASNPTVTFSGQTIMSASFSSANVLTATYTNVKNVVRKFMQAWTIGDKRKITHEEYIVGTDFYTDQLTLVNNLRAAEGVGGGKTPLNNILDNGAAYALARDWNKFTVRQQVVHNPATLVHYDPSFDVEWQTRESQLDAVWTYDVDQPAFFADNLAALVFGDPYENTALWYSDWFYTQWYNSPPHKAWMLYDWTGNGSDASKVFLGGMGLDWSHSYAPAADDPAAIGTQIHYDFSTSYLDDEMERTWNSEYSVVGAELIAFYGEYSTVAWKDIQGQFSFPYALRIATQHSFNYGARTARQIAFPTHYTVTTQIGLPYTGLEPIRAQIGYPYDLKNAVAVKQIGFPYSSHVESILSLPYGDRLQSISQIAFPYSLMPQVTKQIGLPYEGTDPIAAQHGFVYDLLVNNPVISDIALSYALIDDTVINSPDQATVTVGGVTIPVTRADVSISEEDFVWKASVTLAGMSDYNMFVQDDPFQVHIGTDTYEMVVDEKSLSRGEDTNANVNIAVVGLSPAIQYKAPRADVIDFELTTATMAKDVVEGILGTTVQWNVQNWMIPAYRLSATEISPIKLVTQIVEVIGALPEALYDGTLQIRYKWEINTDQYDAVGSPDQIYTDVQDNLSASEQTQPFELFNKFRIREGNGVFSDVIEFFDNDEEDGGNTLAGILRAYPNPWRLNVRIIQTNDGPLPLNYVGVVQREETQLVEFKEGEASVTYPIVSVDSIDWKSYNLGSLVHEDHGRELTAPTDVNYGYGLAEITYTTEAIEYTTSAPFATDAQFLLQDEG